MQKLVTLLAYDMRLTDMPEGSFVVILLTLHIRLIFPSFFTFLTSLFLFSFNSSHLCPLLYYTSILQRHPQHKHQLSHLYKLPTEEWPSLTTFWVDMPDTQELVCICSQVLQGKCRHLPCQCTATVDNCNWLVEEACQPLGTLDKVP